MPTATYRGPLGAVRVRLSADSKVFRRGVPVEVSADDAQCLGDGFTVGVEVPVGTDGAPVVDDLSGLDKAALLAVAGAEDIDVNSRWGASRLADKIRQARLAQPAQEG